MQKIIDFRNLLFSYWSNLSCVIGFSNLLPWRWGRGGHCIQVDPLFCAAWILNRDKKQLNGSKILILGVAYKQDIDDYRESPALKVMELLEAAGCEVSYFDPHVKSCKYKGKAWQGLAELTENALSMADLVIITTAHSAVDYGVVCTKARVILDIKNALKDFSLPKTIIEVL